MSHAHTSLRFLLLATTLAAFAPGARAEDTPREPAPAPSPEPAPSPDPAAAPTAVSRLTSEELAFLRRRLPDFDRRDEAEREKVATNVIRLRSLSPADRKRFVERLHRVEAEGGPGAAAAADRLAQIKRMGHQSFRDGTLRMRAVAAAVVGTLSADRRGVLTPNATPGSISLYERLQFDVCIANAWKRRVVDGLVAKPPVDAEPLAASGASTRFVAVRDRVRAAGGATAPESDRRSYAMAYLEDRATTARRGVEAERPVTTPEAAPAADARLLAFGRALGAAFPSSIEAVAEDVGAAVDGGRAALKKFCDDATPDRGAPREKVLVELVVGLERARPFVGGDVLAKLCELEVSALRELKVPDGDLSKFQPGGDEKARLLVLAPFVRRLGSGERGGAHGPGFRFGGGERDRWGGGRRGAAMSEAGMSEPAMREPSGVDAPDAPRDK